MEKPSGDTVRWYHAQQRITYNGSTMMFIISASAHHHTFNRGISLRAETLINGRAGCASGDLSPHMVLGRRISMTVSDSELETLAALTYALAPNKPLARLLAMPRGVMRLSIDRVMVYDGDTFVL